jgi:acetyl esterase
MAEPNVERGGLRPELRRMLEELDREPPPTPDELTPEARRITSERNLPGLWGELEAVERIDEIVVRTGNATLRARVYRPKAARGTVLFLHGGGWALGSLDTHEGPTRRLANEAACNILSLEYRKGPEHPFPAAVNDVNAGLDWLVRNGPEIGLDTQRIVIAGESAGANLAAVLARHARDRQIALAGQLLIYPVADTGLDTPSYREFAEGFYLTAESMRWFVDQYFADVRHAAHPDAAPLRADDLGRLAPAFVVTAQFDPLRDEGRAYAARLIEAGNNVTYVEWPGVVHGFWLMNAITPAATEVIAAAADWVRGRLL